MRTTPWRALRLLLELLEDLGDAVGALLRELLDLRVLGADERVEQLGDFSICRDCHRPRVVVARGRFRRSPRCSTARRAENAQVSSSRRSAPTASPDPQAAPAAGAGRGQGVVRMPVTASDHDDPRSRRFTRSPIASRHAGSRSPRAPASSRSAPGLAAARQLLRISGVGGRGGLAFTVHRQIALARAPRARSISRTTRAGRGADASSRR